MRWLGAQGNRQKGQNLVEFALIAPVMFLLLFAIIDFGMALDQRITVQHAVREGARYAAVHGGCTDIQDRVADRAGGIFDATEVIVTYSDNPAAAGDTVEVTAPFDWQFPLIGRFGAAAISKRVPASARLEMAVTDAGGCEP